MSGYAQATSVAAQAATLGLIVAIYRRRLPIDVDDLSEMRG